MGDALRTTAGEFFQGALNLFEMNKTYIALIPKIPNPESTSHFRPISLCNNSYKILSKLLANRLKVLLPDIITHNQNAFVPERQIQDNILLAHECFHYLKLKREGGKHELGLKLDMNKAYDRVEWDFLEAVLHCFGFDRGWISLVMSCVTTVSFSVVLNGKAGGFFKPKRGLRQGDPLSPYLFLLVSEVFSLNVSHSIYSGRLLGIKLSRSCPVLSHLFFADDSLIFIRATVENCKVLDKVFKSYCEASGQLINYSKSSLFFSPNTPSVVADPISCLFNIPSVDNPGNYLGLPTIWGKSKKKALVFIKERIQRKVENWKLSSLSMAGREVLIKSVAMAVPSYPMTCFKFPKSLCNEINSVLANFWWGHSDQGNKIHWKNWSMLGLPKSDGGMGFRDLESFNLALLAKQCWRIINNPNDLWVMALKARYFPNSDFFGAVKGYRASWAWSSLIEARDIIVRGSKWQVCNGDSIQIWESNWVPYPHHGSIIPISPVPSCIPTKVGSLIDWESSSWRLDGILPYIQPNIAQLILGIPIGSCLVEDRLVWPWVRNGSYTVRSGYHWHHGQKIRAIPVSTHTSHQVDTACWKAIWSIKTLPKISNFLWRIIMNAVPTFQNLHRRKLKMPALCPICNQEAETIEHVLLLCPWVECVWFGSPLSISINKASITTIDIWVLTFLNSQDFSSSLEKRKILTVISFFLWAIWKSRCAFIYRGTSISPAATIQAAMKLVLDFCGVSSPLACNRLLPELISSWSPPPVHFVKINCDASWIEGSNISGLGCVLRDSRGRFRAGCSRSKFCNSVIEAEATAVIDGLNFAIDLNIPKVIMESDSLEVISCINNPISKCNWKIFPLLKEIRQKALLFADTRADATMIQIVKFYQP